jgi:4a-hydroxytetrahydrobiopterin dehydratase
MKKLNDNEIQERIRSLNGWEYKDNSIQKSFQLKDFSSIMAFVNKAAEEAEKVNHHPDIFIHSWNKVIFILSTHSEGGITEKDFNLAKTIESLQ